MLRHAQKNNILVDAVPHEPAETAKMPAPVAAWKPISSNKGTRAIGLNGAHELKRAMERTAYHTAVAMKPHRSEEEIMRNLRISRYRDGFLVMLEGGKRSTSSQRHRSEQPQTCRGRFDPTSHGLQGTRSIHG
jgi:hypothetical protein